VCVCVCVCLRARARVYVCVSALARTHTCARARARSLWASHVRTCAGLLPEIDSGEGLSGSGDPDAAASGEKL
jgi:hypothetical protein